MKAKRVPMFVRSTILVDAGEHAGDADGDSGQDRRHIGRPVPGWTFATLGGSRPSGSIEKKIGLPQLNTSSTAVWGYHGTEGHDSDAKFPHFSMFAY